MRLFRRKNIVFLIIAVFLVAICYNFPYFLFNYDDNMYVNSEEFNHLKSSGNLFFLNNVTTVSSNQDEILKEYVVKYKLFNLINIKTLKLKVAEKENIYAGGDCLGFTMQSKGALIVGGNHIITKSGKSYPFKDSNLEIGDIIVKINDITISSIQDVTSLLANYDGKEPLNVTAIRGGVEIHATINPAFDMYSRSYKLGIWLKDTVVGVGTLTFINDTTNRFGALGHAVSASDKNGYDVTDGDIYECAVVGVKHASDGDAGQLLGAFSKEQRSLGKIDKNCLYGVFGNTTRNQLLIKNKNTVKVGSRNLAKPGRAKILSTVDGNKIESFDIEIIKTNFQKSSSEKSLVIRVVDKALLKRTGGIVQGMSGSPIIQNGNLIGAVTHVFLNDASKGFGLYIDWMLDE